MRSLAKWFKGFLSGSIDQPGPAILSTLEFRSSEIGRVDFDTLRAHDWQGIDSWYDPEFFEAPAALDLPSLRHVA